MKLLIWSQVAFAAMMVSGCLPGDIRPEPGRVYVTAEPAESTFTGFATADAWNVRFERVVVGLGAVGIRGEACSDYGNTSYYRLFDFVVPETVKLGEVYGLGTCDIRVRMNTPPDDTLLQSGTTEADLAMMREPTVELPDNIPIGIFGDFTLGTTAYVRGSAKREGVTKYFDWKFTGRITVSDCSMSADGPMTSTITLAAGDDFRPKVTFHAEELFRATADAASAIRFEDFANADTNGDGWVEITELEALTAPPVEEEPSTGGMMGGMGPQIPTTVYTGFAKYMNEQLLPRTVYLDGSPCSVSAQRRN